MKVVEQIAGDRSADVRRVIMDYAAPLIGLFAVVFLVVDESIWLDVNPAGFATSLFSTMALLLAPVIWRWTGSYKYTGYLLIIACYVSLSVGAFTTDGILSPQLFLLIQVPIWLALFDTSRIALISLVAVLIAISTIYFYGARIPGLDRLSLTSTVVACLAASMVVMIQLLYEFRQRGLQSRVSRAELADQAKSKFMLSMSHELRAPLNAIMGFAQLQIANEGKSSTVFNERILAASQHMLAIAEEILDAAALREGKLALNLEDVRLDDILSELQPLFDYFSLEHELIVDVPEDNRIVLRADKRAVKQILINLLSNATKYSLHGTQVKVGVLQGTGEAITVYVEDSGPGIAEDAQAAIFRPFERGDQVYHGSTGTGIGLYHSRNLAQLMEGELWYETCPDGSKFFLSLHKAIKNTFPGTHSKRVG